MILLSNNQRNRFLLYHVLLIHTEFTIICVRDNNIIISMCNESYLVCSCVKMDWWRERHTEKGSCIKQQPKSVHCPV